MPAEVLVPSYICMIFSRDDRVLKVENFERDNDEQAEREAMAIMTSVRDPRGYELWRGGRKIAAHLTKRTSPWKDAPSNSGTRQSFSPAQGPRAIEQ